MMIKITLTNIPETNIISESWAVSAIKKNLDTLSIYTLHPEERKKKDQNVHIKPHIL